MVEKRVQAWKVFLKHPERIQTLAKDIAEDFRSVVEPQMTTIDYPGIDMGEIAARNLINHLKGVSNIKHTNTIVVRSDLIIRKSSLRMRK